MIRRDLRDQAKVAGTPWDAAKGFDHSASNSAIKLASDIGHQACGRIWLAVNGTLRQDSDLSLQIWNVQETIAHLSSLFTLIPGPTNVPERILRAMDRPTIGHRGLEFAELALDILHGLKGVFKNEQPVVMYPASGTGACEAALVNTLSPGDKKRDAIAIGGINV